MKRTIIHTLLLVAGISMACAWSETQNYNNMTDKELKHEIDSLAKTMQPLTAEPLIAEAKKRASEAKDTRWMLSLINTDISLNHRRLSEEKTVRQMLEEAIEKGWTPLKQILYLQLYLRYNEYEDAFKAMEESDTLQSIKAIDVVEDELLANEISLFDYIGMTILCNTNSSYVQMLTFEEIDEISKPLAQFAASDTIFSNNFTLLRIIAEKAVASGDELSMMIVQMIRTKLFDEYRSLSGHFDTLMAEIESMPAEQNATKALKIFAKANYEERQAVDDTRTPSEGNAMLEKAIAHYAEASELLPNSQLATMAEGRILEINKKEVSISADEQVAPGTPFGIHLAYRNTDKIRIDVYSEGSDIVNMWALKHKELLQKGKLVQSREIELPLTQSRLNHSTIYTELEGLRPGYYMICANTDGDIRPASITTTHCSSINMGVIDAGNDLYLTLTDFDKGTPITDAQIKEQPSIDKNGWVKWSKRKDKDDVTTITRGDETFVFRTRDLNRWYNPFAEKEMMSKERGEMVTDRRIYRPGQTVFFKGYIYTAYRDRKEAAKEGEKVTVYAKTSNGIDLFKQEFRTNSFGTINGSFALPDNATKGYAYIYIEKKKETISSQSISIEDFKRTDNTIRFDGFNEVLLPSSTVTVSGVCTAASGLPVGDAVVNFEIGCRSKSNLSTGTTLTDSDGRFSFTFNALSKKELEEIRINSNKDFYRVVPTNTSETYSIDVKITDNRGETTKSATHCSITEKGVGVGINTIDMQDHRIVRISSHNSNMRSYANRLHLRIEAYKPRDYYVPSNYIHKADVVLGKTKAKKNVGTGLGEVVFEADFDVDGTKEIDLSHVNLPPAKYLLTVTAPSPAGGTVSTKQDYTIIAGGGHSEHLEPMHMSVPSTVFNGDTMRIKVGSSMEAAQIRVLVVRNNKIVLNSALESSKSIESIAYMVPADAIEGERLIVFAYCTRHGHTFEERKEVVIKRKAEALKIELTTHRDYSQPGRHETWKLHLSGGPTAEVVASMYDSRLDKYTYNGWNAKFSTLGTPNDISFRTMSARPLVLSDYGSRNVWNHGFVNANSLGWQMSWLLSQMTMSIPDDYSMYGSGIMAIAEECETSTNDMMRSAPRMMAFSGGSARKMEPAKSMVKQSETYTVAEDKDSGQTSKETDFETPIEIPRSNFAETVFFEPVLQPDTHGDITVDFDLPDNLTSYRFRALAHDTQMRSDMAYANLIVSKALNVRIGMPRFATEGDKINISADVTITDREIKTCLTKIKLTSPDTGKEIATFDPQTLSFSNGTSQHAEWEINVPEGYESLRVIVTGTSDSHTDGEQYDLHIAKRYIEVPESHTFMLYKEGKQTIDNPFVTGRTTALSFHYTSNTFIEVLRALPNLDKSWYPSSDTYLGRFETSAVARFLASKPEIARAVRYLSEHKEELSTIADAKNTPWLYLVQKIRKHDADVVRLLSDNYAAKNEQKALLDLVRIQNNNGSFPWFKGMDDSPQLTANIVGTIGDMVAMGLVDGGNKHVKGICKKALPYIDVQINEARKEYEKAVEEQKKNSKRKKTIYISYTTLSLIYARVSADPRLTDDIRFFADIISRSWTTSSNYNRVRTADMMLRIGEKETAALIAKSLEENLVQKDKNTAYVYEQGYFRHSEMLLSQARLIMLLHRVNPESANLPKLVNYLITQKRGEAWPDIQTTTQSVLALLGVSSKLSADDSIEVGGQQYVCNVEQPKISIALQPDGNNKKAVIVKGNDTPSWGSWQRTLLTPSDEMKADETEQLKVQRIIEVRRTERGKEVWKPIATTQPQVGDVICVTLKFYNENALSNVRLRDFRAASFEPEDKLSGYRGWWFWNIVRADLPTPPHYMMIGDETVEFFVNHLAKGWHSITYKLVVTHAGDFASGYADAQCMYEPEIKAHSEGGRLHCKEIEKAEKR